MLNLIKNSALSLTFALSLAFVAQPLSAQEFGSFGATSDQDAQQEAVTEGVQHERAQEWLKAIEVYRPASKKWPENTSLKYGLRRAKFQFQIVRRYSDESFDVKLLTLTEAEAFSLYHDMLNKVRSEAVERLSTTSLTAHGTESLYLALSNKKFLEANLSGVDWSRISDFRNTLRNEYWNKSVNGSAGAEATIRQIAQHANRQLGLDATTVIMEYVFGICNALDDYSLCLTPDRLNDLYSSIDGQFVGLGIELKAEPGKGMLLVDVLDDSPAERGGMFPGDHIVKIDGIDCRNMNADEASKLLRGTKGSRVRIGLVGPRDSKLRENVFERQPVNVKSIPVVKMVDHANGIGYIRMAAFQKTSAAELDQAIATLKAQGMKALIWDVRGNPGGLLTAAVEVLDRFIEEGALVSTKGRVKDQNWNYSAHRQGTHNFPLVLLIDGDSASASEIVAGCVRDHRRGTIVGRQSYGKWSVQSIFPMRYSMGLRVTTAKFYSPNGNTYGGVGLKPHVTVELPKEQITAYRAKGKNLTDDLDVQKGVDVLKQIATR